MRRVSIQGWCAVLFCCTALCGCKPSESSAPAPKPSGSAPPSNSQEPPPNESEPTTGETTEPAAAALTPEQVKLTLADWETVAKKAAEHPGKVVVLDLWSTSCEPCIREFHHLVALSRKHPERVVCLSISFDYAGIKSKPPETYEERVRKFLSEQGATFDNYLCTQDPELVYQELDLASIPAVMVFGLDGKLVERFDNDAGKYGDEFTYADHVLPRVEALLAAE